MISYLTKLKRMHFTFSAKVTLLKAYGTSLLLYCAPYVTISRDQINLINKIFKWFLFSDKKEFNPSENSYPNIKLQRLELNKNDGGLFLQSIEEMFSLAKTHVVLLAKSHPHKKPWMDCLLQLLDDHFKENSQLFHPLYCFELPSQAYQLPFKKWIRQMLITFHQVPRKFTFRSPQMKNFVVIALPLLMEPSQTVLTE